MKLNKRLNLVIPVTLDDGQVVHVHSTPVSPEFFAQHYLLIGKVFSALFTEGLGPIGGPRVAAHLMRDRGGEQASQVMAEIRRLSNVVSGSNVISLQEAVDKGIIDPTDLDTLENMIVFFTVVSAMMKPTILAEMIQSLCDLWASQSTSLNSTEWGNSSPTSTVAESSGAKVAASLVPH